MAIDPLAVAGLLASILDRLTIAYAVGARSRARCLASRGQHTIWMSSPPSDRRRLNRSAALEDSGFYVPRSAARNAVAAKRSFSIVHLDTSLKVDIFVAGRTPLD